MENEFKKEKVLIIVSGGVVQSIYASNKDLQIDIFDLDNEEFDSMEEADKEAERRSKDLIPLL